MNGGNLFQNIDTWYLTWSFDSPVLNMSRQSIVPFGGGGGSFFFFNTECVSGGVPRKAQRRSFSWGCGWSWCVLSASPPRRSGEEPVLWDACLQCRQSRALLGAEAQKRDGPGNFDGWLGVSDCLFIYVFYNFIVPLGVHPWENWVVFPRES